MDARGKHSEYSHLQGWKSSYATSVDVPKQPKLAMRERKSVELLDAEH